MKQTKFIQNTRLPGRSTFRVVFLCLLLGACTAGKKTTQDSPALKLMAKEFQGSFEIEYIQKEVDETFKAYEFPINELNYQRFADTLLKLRKASKNGVSEMDILAHVKAINARSYGVSLFKQLEASAKFLEKKPLDLPS